MKNLLKHIRNELNLSQQDFADHIGVAFATVNRWENGKSIPSKAIQKVIYELCKNFKIDIYEYIFDKLTADKMSFERNNGELLLFHGSKSGIEGDIKPKSRVLCDFGKGFYMGTDIIQPLTLICTYDAPKLYLASIKLENLKVKILPTDIDWALVVAYNRGKLERIKGNVLYDKYASMMQGYDIIIGDIADDRMFFVLDNFFEGLITDKGLVQCLSTLNLGKQYVAITEEACKKINIIKQYEFSEIEKMALKDMSETRRALGVAQANEICKGFRRDGKFFDEILEGK